MKYDCSYRVIQMDERSPVADLLKRPPSDGIPKYIFESIAAHFPDYVTFPGSIKLERPKGHRNLDELLSFAVEAGATIQKDRSDFPAQVCIRDYEVYSAEINEAACLLECEIHEASFDAIDTVATEDGLGIRHFFSRPPSAKSREQNYGSCGNLFHLLAVRGEAKKRLQESGLKHLQLVPMITDAADGRWPDAIEPLYLLWSNYRLPPVDLPVFDNSYNIYPRNCRPERIDRGCYLLDGCKVDPQLVYETLDLEAFDIARTYERFGGDQPCYHKLVYSQRARKVLEEIGMNLKLRPVILG